jgi:Flp pilus assembly protein TadG
VRAKRQYRTNSGAKPRRWSRRGAATVEMAIVTPILLAMLFGIVEYGWVFMLQSNVTSATREACRVGILSYASTTDADTAIKNRLATAIAGTGLTEANGGYTVTIARATGANNVQTVTVTTSVPWSKASLVGGGVLPDPRAMLKIVGGGSYTARTSNLVASCSMMKEGT